MELNPLGWPLGILGAFAFYGPTLVFSYVLLFKIRETNALYAAIGLTMITLGMSAMNLFAGAQNFQVFVDTAKLATLGATDKLVVSAKLAATLVATSSLTEVLCV